jgi:PAS domain S-box-containing protein
MEGDIRKSGLAAMGNVPWGTHFCQFYQTKQDLIDTLVPYFKAGLENNEFCLWVTTDNLTAERARKAMTKAVKDFPAYLKKGQIEILPYDEWYLKGGHFKSKTVLNGLIRKLNQALKQGYAGLRLTDNTFWLEKKDWRSFTEYEEAVNHVICNYKMIALCAYSLKKCSAAEIVDVIRNHKFALIKQEDKWELFENSRYRATKEHLGENEKRFRLALKNAPVTVAAQDLNLRFLWAYNQRTIRPQDVLGKTDFDLFSKPDARKLSTLKNKVMATGKALNKKMWVTSNHKKVYLEIFLEPMRSEIGKITGVEVATVDLTREKVMEDALKENTERFKVIASNTPDHIIVQDNDLRYTFVVNPQLGLTEQDMVGKTDYAILKKEDADNLIKIKRQVIESGKPISLETSLVDQKGETNYFSGSYVPKFNEQGKVDGLIGYFRNISERKKTEQNVFRLNRELQAIRECDQIIVHSPDETALLTDVCKILCTTAGYRLAWIGSVDHDESKSIRPLVWHGDGNYLASANITWADTDRGRGPTGLTARTGKTHFFQDFATASNAEPWRKAALSRGYRSSIAIPLKDSDGSVFAVLSLYSPEPNSFNSDEIRLLEELALDISFGIIALRERAKRHQAELESAHLASFPELNPNPIIELETSGKIVYLNLAAKDAFPDISLRGPKHPFLFEWENLVETIKNQDTQSVTREINVGQNWYLQNVIYVPSTNHYHIYGRNITERRKVEDALKESEENNRLIIETALDGVWTNDLSGRLLYVNDAYCQMIGYTREELLSMFIYDIEAVEKREETNEHINKIIRHGEDQFETRHKRKDGKVIDIEISAKYAKAGNGQFVVFARDITARKKAEAELKASEERFSNAFHSSPVALSISRISDGTFVDANQSFLHLFGYKREEIVGQKATELNIYDNPNDRSEIVRLLEQQGKVVNYRVTARTKNGNEIKALTSAEKIELNGQGHINWTTIDVTEREQAEDLLRETSNYLNNLLDYANAPIIVWDTHFRISRFNPAFERLTGYQSQEVIGLGLDILFPEDKKTASMQLIRLTLSGERWEVVEIPIRRIDGEVRTVLWNSANVYDNDGKVIIATIAQGQDITARKKAEEAIVKLNEELKQHSTELEATNKELEAFSYSVSHDLRAPLRSMEGFSQALLEDCQDILNDECKNYLKRIQNSAELMAQLIDDLLQLSRLTRVDMVFNNVKLSDIAQSIAGDLKKLQPKRNIEFIITPGLTDRGDEKLLRIALTNLFENGWKFTGKVPAAHIEFGVTEKDCPKVYFVRDNGAGFDMTYADKLFKPFQRLHSSTEFPGTGIGLASVQRIIHRHGGQVWAEGKVGKGATFYFTLA